MKKNKNLIFIGGGLLTVLIGYFAYDIVRNLRKKADAKTNELETKNTENLSSDGTGVGREGSNSAKTSNDQFPLKVGSYGFKVSMLQSALKNLGASIIIDGKFGSKTYDAIGAVGELSYFTWTAPCSFAYNCGLDDDEYSQILNNAKRVGWIEEEAFSKTKENWNQMDGDEIFKNLMGLY